MRDKLIFRLILVLFLIPLLVVAQEENETKSQINIGLTSFFDIPNLMVFSLGKDEDVNYYVAQPFFLGAFITSPKIEAKLGLGFPAISTDFKYNFNNYLFAEAHGYMASYRYDVYGFGINQNYDNWLEDSPLVMHYRGGIGAQVDIAGAVRICVKGYLGSIMSESSEYDFSTRWNSAENKMIRITNGHELGASFIYGGGLGLETLPRKNKINKDRWTYFLSIDVLGNNKANFSRQVQIEEWVPGNVVYRESTEDFDYQIAVLDIEFGVKYWFNYK